MARSRRVLVFLAVVTVTTASLWIATRTRSAIDLVHAPSSRTDSTVGSALEVVSDPLADLSESTEHGPVLVDGVEREPHASRTEAILPLPEGLTEEHRRELLSLRRSFHGQHDVGQTICAFGYARASVAILLRSEGRADEGTPEEREQGLRSRPGHENEWVLSAGGARFRFERGEFPAFDQVQDLWQSTFGPEADQALSRKREKLEPLPEDLIAALDVLAEQALDAFGSAD